MASVAAESSSALAGRMLLSVALAAVGECRASPAQLRKAAACEEQPDAEADSGDEGTPTTTATSECCSELGADEEEQAAEQLMDKPEAELACSSASMPPQLGPGLFLDDDPADALSECEGQPSHPSSAPQNTLTEIDAARDIDAADDVEEAAGDGFFPGPETQFDFDETMFIFDWDDTILPSSWIQRQGLRLDAASQLSDWQREQLCEASTYALETLRLAKQHGVVILVTNAERGWIELSCQKFVPQLLPIIEGVKVVSARTTYEGPCCPTPLEWKIRAFEEEIAHAIGIENVLSPSRRKNILSLGDSLHEREALHRAIGAMPGAWPKSLKYIERPDVSQICKQHALVTRWFDMIVHHDGDLDLCINCD